MNDLVEKIEQTIKQKELISAGDSVLVALSGGADSVCLLRVLCALRKSIGFSVLAAHLNHGLRGADADGDEAFAKALCRELGVPFVTEKCDVKALAEAQGVGLEEAGRTARYAFFDKVLKAEGLTKIATAHHADDNAETVLMRLIRGTGPVGLAGIPYQNGAVIRPMLDVSRKEIEVYLSEQKQDYRIDSSNESCEFTRNRVRHQLIPFIEQAFNPGFRQTLQRQIKTYAENAAFLEEETEMLLSSIGRPIEGGYCFLLADLENAPRFLTTQLFHKVLSTLSGAECSQLAIGALMRILERREGSVSLAGDLVALVLYDMLYIKKSIEPKLFSHPFDVRGGAKIPETGAWFTVESVMTIPENKQANELFADADVIFGKTLCVRSRQAGDVFYPVGMEGKKSLQDFFVDAKIPFFVRDEVPILSADDEIVWVCGMRADRRFAATKETKNIIRIRYFQGEN